MSKFLKYLFISIISFFAVIFIAAAAIIMSSGDEIKEAMVKELNRSIGGNLIIQGDLHFAFFSHFPNIALELNSVELYGSETALETPFIKAERVYLLAGIWEVLTGNWNIKSTMIENGEVNLLRNENGQINYQFGQEEEGVNGEAAYAIAIEKALLKNIRFKLEDEIADILIHLSVDDAKVRGNFTSENLSVKATGNIHSHFMRIKDVDYAQDKEISFDGSLGVTHGQESYLLAIERFFVENAQFAIHGSITMDENDPVFDLTVRGKNISMREIPSLMPVQYIESLQGIKGNGSLQLAAEVKGKLGANTSPMLTVAIGVSGAAIEIPGIDHNITSLSFKVTFTNGAKQSLSTSSLTVANLTAKTKQGVLDAGFTITNFNQPHLKVNAEGKVDLSLFSKFLDNESRLREMRGIVEFKKIKYNGKASELANFQLNGLEGSVSLRQVQLKVDTMRIEIFEGTLESYQKSLTIEQLAMKLPGSKFVVNGKLTHLPVMSSKKSKNVPQVELDIKAESIDVRSIMAMLSAGESTQQSSAQPLTMNGTVKLTSNFVGFNRFKAYDASCVVNLSGNIIDVKDFSCNTMEGILDVNTRIELAGNKMKTTTHAEGSGINIKELFYQLENFNQNTITEKHVNGKLKFKSDVKAEFVNGTLNEKTLTAATDLTITDGQLVGFEPMEKLSKFIAIEELQNIRFSKLQNNISIANQTVSIPEMLIQSNALNLSVAGSQTFDDKIDYQVKLNLFDVLGKKIRKRKDLTEYEEVGENNFNFYLTMSGTLDKPVIKYDKIGIKEKFAQQKDDFKLFNINKESLKEKPNDAPVTVAPTNVPKERMFIKSKTKKEKGEEVEYIEW